MAGNVFAVCKQVTALCVRFRNDPEFVCPCFRRFANEIRLSHSPNALRNDFH